MSTRIRKTECQNCFFCVFYFFSVLCERYRNNDWIASSPLPKKLLFTKFSLYSYLIPILLCEAYDNNATWTFGKRQTYSWVFANPLLVPFSFPESCILDRIVSWHTRCWTRIMLYRWQRCYVCCFIVDFSWQRRLSLRSAHTRRLTIITAIMQISVNRTEP